MLQNVCFDKLNVFRLCTLYIHVICFCICICLCFSLKINKLQKKTNANKHQRILRGQSTMDNPEKLGTQTKTNRTKTQHTTGLEINASKQANCWLKFRFAFILLVIKIRTSRILLVVKKNTCSESYLNYDKSCKFVFLSDRVFTLGNEL